MLLPPKWDARVGLKVWERRKEEKELAQRERGESLGNATCCCCKMGWVRLKTSAETSVSLPSLVSAAALTWFSAAPAYSRQTSALWSFVDLLPKAAASSVLRIGPAGHEGGRQVGRGAPVPKDKICKGHWALTSHFYPFSALSWVISQAVKSHTADR